MKEHEVKNGLWSGYTFDADDGTKYITKEHANGINVPAIARVVDGRVEEISAVQVGGPKASSPLETQVGGSHYKDFPIQPVEFCQKNKLPFIESCVVKYVCRHRNKDGLKDLEKAKHFIDLLIALEYGEKAE